MSAFLADLGTALLPARARQELGRRRTWDWEDAATVLEALLDRTANPREPYHRRIGWKAGEDACRKTLLAQSGLISTCEHLQLVFFANRFMRNFAC